MTTLHFFVLLNNIICISACATCFFHGLHGGLYTNILTKIILYITGFAFFTNIIDSRTLLLPGHQYIIGMNIVFGFSMLCVFYNVTKRSGYLQSWYLTVQHILLYPFGGVKNEGRNTH